MSDLNSYLNIVYFSIAAACYSFHYIKRLLETVFVHRFSNATMPIMNLFKVGYSSIFKIIASNYNFTEIDLAEYFIINI